MLYPKIETLYNRDEATNQRYIPKDFWRETP